MKRLLLALLILAVPLASLAEAASTAEPATWQLTVNFLYEDGSEAKKSVTQQLAAGDAYSVDVPEIDGYEADPARVKGTMPDSDLEIDVKYSAVVQTTSEATAEPTEEPTVEPTEDTTVEPTEEPTAEPTEEPTTEPTEEPTSEPTEEPTTEPTEESTTEPTEEPTAEPTEEPTVESTEEPTAAPTEEPTTEPTEESTAEPTEEPTAEPTAEPDTGVTLTIHYVMGESTFGGFGPGGNSANADSTAAPSESQEDPDAGDGAEDAETDAEEPEATPVAEDYVLTGLKKGDAYDVVSPTIEGLTPDLERVTGVMGDESIEITVTYTSSMGGFPGGMGGFHGGMSGMAGMEGMDMGFRVTPGEALTDIHTSGDCTMTVYGTVVLTGDEAAPLTDDAGEALSISLLLSGETVAFAAEIQEDTLVLTGEAGCWQVGGDALKILAQSGVTRLALVTGGEAAWMSTADFASGYTWDCLQKQGLPSAKFVYELDASAQTLQLNVANAIYSAGDISAVVAYGAADGWQE